jgi:malate synthase
VQYLEAWLRGSGCVPLYHLMEDAATAEISRSQLWQWVHHGARLDDGRKVDVDLFRSTLDDEMAALRDQLGADRFEAGKFAEATSLFDELVTADELAPFLTLPAYEHLKSTT